MTVRRAIRQAAVSKSQGPVNCSPAPRKLTDEV